jgi:hypothetical protein
MCLPLTKETQHKRHVINCKDHVNPHHLNYFDSWIKKVRLGFKRRLIVMYLTMPQLTRFIPKRKEKELTRFVLETLRT